MGGTLYIVGTPIGNLEDVTLRALRVLREVDLIAAEDTRRTARLLQHYSIATPATSLHEHNEHGKSPHLVAKLLAGASIALVSDAGMPLVSDPGALLVRAVREAGLAVEVVPGPSAITAALAAAGISGPFAFLGFPPGSGRARQTWLDELGHITATMPGVFFESPHRIERTMGEIAIRLGERPIIVARELTKLHESLVEQPINRWLLSREGATSSRGEHVIIVTRAQRVDTLGQERPTDTALLAEIGQMTESGQVKPKEAAKALARKYGMAANEVYALHSRRDK